MAYPRKLQLMKCMKAQKRVRTGVLIAYHNIHHLHEVTLNICFVPCPYMAAVLSDLLNRKIAVLILVVIPIPLSI
jgi:hypothetical protein